MSLDDVYRAFAGTPDSATCPARVPAPARTVGRLGHVGRMGHHKKEERQDKAGPAHEVETLLGALADADRDLSPELTQDLRERLAPLSRRVRAELVAVIDDAFEITPDTATARQQAHRLLTDEKALQAAKAVWPAYPDPPGTIEPLAPWPGSKRPSCTNCLTRRAT